MRAVGRCASCMYGAAAEGGCTMRSFSLFFSILSGFGGKGDLRPPSPIFFSFFFLSDMRIEEHEGWGKICYLAAAGKKYIYIRIYLLFFYLITREYETLLFYSFLFSFFLFRDRWRSFHALHISKGGCEMWGKA